MAKKNRAKNKPAEARAGKCLPKRTLRNANGSDTTSTMYGRYKKATLAFRECLAALLPASIPLISVADLGNSTEYLLNEMTDKDRSSPLVTPALLSHLDESIQLREKFTAVFKDDDDGHAYMIGMLRYCRSLLQECRRLYLAFTPSKQKRAAPNSINISKSDSNVTNRFDVLNLGDESEEEDEEEKTITSLGQNARPKDPVRPYSIQKDLIDGSDRTRARVYMFQVEMLFEMVDYHYRVLKTNVQEVKTATDITSDHIDSIIVVLTIKAAAASNMALEEIKYLEDSLKAESPQFKTHYHIIAVLVFGALISQIETQISPKVIEIYPHLGLDYVAKEVEIGFRTPMDPIWYNPGKRVKLFQKSARIGTNDTKGIIVGISRIVPSITFLEVGLDFAIKHAKLKDVVADCIEVREMYCRNTRISLEKLATSWHAVGKGSIGGRRSLVHTQSMIQSQTHILTDLTPQRKTIRWDQMGPTWDEDTCPANGTADACMDDFYYRSFYQNWFIHTRFGANKYKIIFQDALPRVFPLLQGLLDKFDSRDEAIPLSYSIAVHGMLTAMVCVQGDGDLMRVASVSKLTAKNFHKQIADLRALKDVHMTEHIAGILEKVQAFEDVTKPTLNSRTSSAEDTNSMWNPLIAGSLLMQTIYLNSLRFGVPAINTHNQAVATLHILNALQERNLIDISSTPLLGVLDAALGGSKAIWGDGKPKVGSFTKYYFVSIGTSLHASENITKFVKSMPWYQYLTFQENMSEEKKAQLQRLLVDQIDMEDNFEVVRLRILMGMRETFKRGSRVEQRAITPGDISLSYRYCVDHNFSGNVEDVSAGNSIDAMSSAGTYATLMNYYERYKALDTQMPLDAMMLSMNFPKLTWVLSDFMSKLDEAMGWNGIISELIEGPLSDWRVTNTAKRRYALLNLIGDRIISELDSDLECDMCTEGKKCAAFMKTYFEPYKKSDVAIF